MQAEIINNEAEKKEREFSLPLDTKIKIEESWTPSLKRKEVKCEEKKSSDKISKRRDCIKDF